MKRSTKFRLAAGVVYVVAWGLFFPALGAALSYYESLTDWRSIGSAVLGFFPLIYCAVAVIPIVVIMDKADEGRR